VRECSAPSVNFGPPHISETIRRRELKFYTHLDIYITWREKLD